MYLPYDGVSESSAWSIGADVMAYQYGRHFACAAASRDP